MLMEQSIIIIYVESLDEPIDREFIDAYTDYSKITANYHSIGSSSRYSSYVMMIVWRLS